MRFDRLQPTPNERYSDKLERLLKENISPKVKRTLGQHKILEFQRTRGLSVLKLLPGTKTPPVFTIRLRRDGTISAPSGQRRRQILLEGGTDLSAFTGRVRAAVVRTAMDHPETGDVILRMAAYNQKDLIRTAVDRTVTNLVNSILTTAVTPAGERRTSPRNLTTLWNRLVRTHFLDPQVLRSAPEFHNHKISADSHNLILRNITPATSETSSPEFKTLFNYFLHHFAQHDPGRPLKGVEELNQLMGQLLNIPPEHQPYLHPITSKRWVHEQRSQQAVSAACQAMAEAGIPPDDETLLEMARMDHLAILEKGPGAWRQWTSAIRTYAGDRDTQALSDTNDRLNPKTRSRKRDQFIHIPTPLYQVIEHIHGDASKAVTQDTPPWTPFRTDRNGRTRILRVMVGPRGDSALTVTRAPNGALDLRSPYVPSWNKPYTTRQHLTDPLINHLAHQLLRHTAKALPELMKSLITNNNTLHTPAVEAHKAAKEIARTTVSTGNPEDFRHLVSNTNRAIQLHIADAEITRLTKAIFTIDHPPIKWSEFQLSLYNTTALNIRIFKQMEDTGQSAPLSYHCLHLTDRLKPIRIFQHPGQIIQEVKDVLKLTKSQWRYFCLGTPINHNHSPANPAAISDLALSCQALADANRPRADQQSMQNVFLQTRSHHYFNDAQWEHGNAWNAWTNLLARYLEPGEQPKTTGQLNRIADALRTHIQQQLPWGAGDWDTLSARSDRWHREHFEERNNLYSLPEETKDVQWESALPETVINEVTFTPLNSPAELTRTGDRMGNCIATYWRRCNDGDSRIFAASQGDTLRAAVELINRYDKWTVNQIESPGRGPVENEITRSAALLARAYDDAHSLLTEAGDPGPGRENSNHVFLG